MTSYTGEMVEGQRSGKGKYTWQAGAIIPGDADPPKKQPGGQFEGMYLDHKKAGEGTASYIQKQRREELHSKYIGALGGGGPCSPTRINLLCWQALS